MSSGGTRIWVDAGSGTLGPLQRHVRLEELDAIWISHLHADHSADLLTAYSAHRPAARSNRPSPSPSCTTDIR
ncbi:MBL fold metallo-hydrolase [Streptomyces coeruleorubidus]|uniref:MBL fold metallo-hydrolase n=1 Tax=Streptomyces coeruleorubidus TaxID=116188 RepID=UPI0037A9D991